MGDTRRGKGMYSTRVSFDLFLRVWVLIYKLGLGGRWEDREQILM